MKRLFKLFALALCLVPAFAGAHQFQGMSTQIVVDRERISATLRLVAVDALLLAPAVDTNKDARMSKQEFEAGRDSLLNAVHERFLVEAAGTRIEAVKKNVLVTVNEGFTDEPHELSVNMQYAAPAGAQFSRIFINPNLFRDVPSLSPLTGKPIQNSQQNTISVLECGRGILLQSTGSTTYEGVLENCGKVAAKDGASTAAIASGAVETTGPVATASTGTTSGQSTSTPQLLGYFTWQGMLHILLGWDHIFFVVALLVAARDLRTLVKVITAFTVAHSITLIITAMNIIHLKNPAIVEAVIALSIAYVGLENLLRLDKTTDWRWIVAFGFGLIHGMGFASALRENIGTHLPGSTGLLVSALLVFNLGVEIGQILIVAALFPLLMVMRRRNPLVARRVIAVASVAVVVMGMSWFLDRTILPGRLPWVF